VKVAGGAVVCLHRASERRLRPVGAGDEVVVPCGADCAVLLGPGAHGRTPYAACGRSARTAAVSQTTKRACRAPPPALRCSPPRLIAGAHGAQSPLAGDTQVGTDLMGSPGSRS